MRTTFIVGLKLLTAIFTIGPDLLLAQAVDYSSQTIRIALAEEPPDLNSMRSTDTVSFFVLAHTNEGLLRYDRRGRLAPGVAHKWEMDSVGATFWLRQDARWSDGEPVTARDFAFAWRTVLAPGTASQYAYILYPIKNGEAVNRGEKPADALGITVVDDYTLKVEFERPCPYFLSLTAFGTYYPVREDFYAQRDQRYAADAGDMLFNGPFKLSEWVHGASLKLVKNEHYWDRDKIQINTIEAPYITSDTRARFNLFKDNHIAMTGLDAETLKDALEQRYKIKKFAGGALIFLEFNHRQGRLTGNKKLRQAIQAVVDPRELVDKVIATPGNIPGYSLFPGWLKGVNESFREEYPERRVAVDIERGQALLEQARIELGLEQLPPLVYLTGDSPTSSKQAEYLQNRLQRTLGLELKIDKQTFKQRLAKMTSGEFDIVAAGWGPDFDDVMTFGDLFASWNENNRGRFAAEEYDRQIEIAQNSVDSTVRMEAMAKIQEIVVEEVAILPLFESASVYVQHPKIKGVVRTIFGGDPNYTYARIVE